MAKTTYRYVPKIKGFSQMFCAPEVCQLMTQHAESIASTANGMYAASGYKVSEGRPGKKGKVKRAHALVYTGDRHSLSSNIVHNTLQKALG